MRAIARILVSFCSMLLAVAIFSLLLARMGSVLFVLKVTMIFAMPVWLINCIRQSNAPVLRFQFVIL